MARKKFYTQDTQLNIKERLNVWHVGIYLRLSNSKDYSTESDSISSQRLLVD
jgi:hypothetical protein